MVGDVPAVGGRDLVGYDGEAVVHLHGVGIDDFALEAGG
jgi:hypothetical protein